MPKPPEPRFPLSRIISALMAAGISESDRERIVRQLQKRREKPGPKGKDDQAAALRVLDIAEERRVSLNTAAQIFAQQYPEEEREPLRKRLARKAKQLEAMGQEIIDEAARAIVAKQAEEQRELQYLRTLHASKKP